ncbi:MAG TPA: ABC transporter permease [Nitrospiraceae bacterium]|nr:ABC transporter permease [Nitrospiraceae bacterium]
MLPSNRDASPVRVFTTITNHWDLVRQLSKREISSRYRGSVIGVVWAFVHPMVMLAVYTAVFRGAFGMRWGGENENALDFALLAFSGLVVHGVFSETIHRAPHVIVNNPSYVKKIVFPLEILAWTSSGVVLVHAGISVAGVVICYGLLHQSLQWTVLFLPLLVLPLALISVGLMWFLASAGVFLRDISQASGPIASILLFLSPIFYPITALPETYRVLVYANPLTFLIGQAQDLLIWGRAPAWGSLGLYCAFSYLFAWLGLLCFQKTRDGFADVL